MRILLATAVLVLIGALSVDTSKAAAPNARIQVRVTDESGAPVNGAIVSARLTWKTKPSVATSTPDGMADLPGLRADERYVVRVARIDYAVVEVDVVPSQIQRRGPVNVRLSQDLCDTALKMDGAGWARLLEPDSAKTSMVFSSWYLTGLPGGGGSAVIPEECRKTVAK